MVEMVVHQVVVLPVEEVATEVAVNGLMTIPGQTLQVVAEEMVITAYMPLMIQALMALFMGMAAEVVITPVGLELHIVRQVPAAQELAVHMVMPQTALLELSA